MKKINIFGSLIVILSMLFTVSCYESGTTESVQNTAYAKKEILYVSAAYEKTETIVQKMDNDELFSDVVDTEKEQLKQQFEALSLTYKGATLDNAIDLTTLNSANTTLTQISTDYAAYNLELSYINEIMELNTNAIAVLETTDPDGDDIQLLEVELPYSEAFSDENFLDRGWFNIAEKGERTWGFWIDDDDSSNYNVSIGAYQSSDDENDVWMISPVLNLTADATLSFQCELAYYSHAGLDIYISTDFDGTVSGSTWDKLTITFPVPDIGQSSSWATYSYDLSGSEYIGEKAVIAFKYEGSAPAGKTGTYRIKHFLVSEPLEPLTEVSLDFEELFSDVNFQDRGWLNVAEVGTQTWQGNSTDGNVFIDVSESSDTANEAWLISPLIDFSANANLEFQSAVASYSHEGLSVHISTDFEGVVSFAEWIQLEITLPGSDATDNDFSVSSLNLSEDYTGEKGVIGFKYSRSSEFSPNESSIYRLKNLSVTEVVDQSTETTVFEEAFAEDGFTDRGWTEEIEAGTKQWTFDDDDDGGFVYFNPYSFNDDGKEDSNISWLISPSITIPEEENIYFNADIYTNFWTHEGLSIWVSTDYTDNVSGATWFELNATIPSGDDEKGRFISTGDVSLSGYTGSDIYIAFKYTGGYANGQETSLYRLKNFRVYVP